MKIERACFPILFSRWDRLWWQKSSGGCGGKNCLVIFDMLLMLSGDIESNPGPMSKIESEAFAAAMLTIQKLEEGHAALSAQLSETIEKLTASTNEVARLTERILALESSVASRSATGTGTPNNSLHQISDHLTEITSRCNDTENRQRRSNLLFFLE